MRYPAAEKLDIIRPIEHAPLPVRRALAKLDISRAPPSLVRSVPPRRARCPGGSSAARGTSMEPHSAGGARRPFPSVDDGM